MPPTASSRWSWCLRAPRGSLPRRKQPPHCCTHYGGRRSTRHAYYGHPYYGHPYYGHPYYGHPYYGHAYSGYTHSGLLHHGRHFFSQVYVPLVPRTHLSVAGAPFPYILGVPAHLLPALGRAAPSVGAGGEVWVWLDDGLVQGAPLQPLPSAYAYAYASASA